MPGGPASYNNWVKDHPLTTNSIYGHLIQKQVEENKAKKAFENHEKLQENKESKAAESHYAQVNTNVFMKNPVDLTHSRKTNYYIAEPLPDSITKGRFKRKFMFTPKTETNLASSSKDIYLWNAVSGCTVRPTM